MKFVRDVPLRFGTGGPIIGTARIYEDNEGLRIHGLLDKDASSRLVENGLAEFTAFTAFIPQ